jgi:hypothetical protein
MENYFQLVATSSIYDVSFQGVQYEVQICREEITSLYREDGEGLTREEFDGVQEYLSELLSK